MSSEFLTVDAVASVLGVHPKTVLRFIREGRLRAGKVGRQYRVLRSDLNAFAGPTDAPRVTNARSTSIVDIDNVDDVLLQRLSAVLIGASKRGERPGTPVSLDIAHDPARQSAKVIVLASPTDASVLLKLIDACLQDVAGT